MARAARARRERCRRGARLPALPGAATARGPVDAPRHGRGVHVRLSGRAATCAGDSARGAHPACRMGGGARGVPHGSHRARGCTLPHARGHLRRALRLDGRALALGIQRLPASSARLPHGGAADAVRRDVRQSGDGAQGPRQRARGPDRHRAAGCVLACADRAPRARAHARRTYPRLHRHRTDAGLRSGRRRTRRRGGAAAYGIHRGGDPPVVRAARRAADT